MSGVALPQPSGPWQVTMAAWRQNHAPPNVRPTVDDTPPVVASTILAIGIGSVGIGQIGVGSPPAYPYPTIAIVTTAVTPCFGIGIEAIGNASIGTGVAPPVVGPFVNVQQPMPTGIPAPIGVGNILENNSF